MANGIMPRPSFGDRLRQLFQQRLGAQDGIGGVLSGANPLFNLGVNLLAASGPRPQGTASFGTRLAEALTGAQQMSFQAALRERVVAENEAQRKRLEALQRLPGILSAPPRRAPGEELAAGEGVLATADMVRPQLLATLAQAAPDAFAKVALESLFAQPQRPTGVEADLQAIESRVGPLTREEIFSIANAGGTQINIGDRELDKPMSPSEIATLRTPEGGTLPLGTTPRQAAALGARVFTASELSRRSQVENALGVFQQLQDLAVGPEGVFRGVPDNLLGRWAEGLGNFFGDVFGTAESVRRETYTSLSRGTVGPLIRSLGESGALADKDVERALSLLSDIEGVPEGESVAKSKFRELGQILNRAAANVGVDTASGRDVIDLGGGVTLEFID